MFTSRFAFTSYNALTGILFVARKYVNESYKSSFIELSVDNSKEQVDQYVTKVKLPFYVRVTIRENIAQDKGGTPHYATYEIIRKKPFYGDLKEESLDNIVEIKPHELVFTNTCPHCGKEGRPRINKKNNKDYTHYKSDYDREEYRLIYFHKQEDSKIKPCVIAKFGKHGIFTKTGKISKTVEDYIFPNYIIKNI